MAEKVATGGAWMNVCRAGWLVLAGLFCAACASTDSPVRVENQIDERNAHFYPGTFRRLEAAIAESVKQGTVPAGCLAIARGQNSVYMSCWGYTRPSGGRPVNSTTLFDVASLTKPLAGVPLALMLTEASGSECRQEWRKLQPLLTHTRGGFYRYDNANYVALQLYAEECPHDWTDELRGSFWQVLGMNHATYRPDPEVCVWTGIDAKGRFLAGRPYDPLAARLQAEQRFPIAHSGLFASAQDVLRFGMGVLEDDSEVAELSEKLLGESRLYETEGSGKIRLSSGGLRVPRDRGFAPVYSPGDRFYYHTGYTGCLLWFDQWTGTVVVLLTNASAGAERDDWQELAKNIVAIVADGTERGYRWTESE